MTEINNLVTEYEVVRGKPEIHIIGLDEKFKEHHIVVYNFRPHFFIEKEYFNQNLDKIRDFIVSNNEVDLIPHKNRNAKVIDVYTNLPEDIPQIREILNDDKKHYEGDVLYPLRFIIDKGIYKSLCYDDDKVVIYEGLKYIDEKYVVASEKFIPNFYFLCMDLEVAFKNNIAPNYHNPFNEIMSIAFMDPQKMRLNQFIVSPTPLEKRKINVDKICPEEQLELNEIKTVEFEYNTEVEMLRDVVKFLNDIQPNILTAYNGDYFDFPYLFNRLKYLHIDFTCLSRLNKAFITKDTKIPVIKGLIFFDSLDGYKKMTLGSEESYSLDYTSRTLFGMGKIGYEEEKDLMDLYKHNYDKFKLYNKYDVILEYALIKKKQLLWFFYMVKSTSGSAFNDVTWNSRTVDCLFLKKAKQRGEVLPTKAKRSEQDEEKFKKHKKVKGANVFKAPDRGIFHNVCAIDLSQSYPSSARTINLGCEKYVYPITDTKNPLKNVPKDFDINNKIGPLCLEKEKSVVYVSKEYVGIIADVFAEYMQIRDNLKKRFKETGDPQDFVMQEVFKFIVNSIYGVLLFPIFRLYDRIEGALITHSGRTSVMIAKDTIVYTLMLILIYGDTDSVYFKSKFINVDDMVKETYEIIEIINKKLQEYYINELHCDNCYIKFDLDKICQSAFFKYKKGTNEPAKKTYATRVIYAKGKKMDKIDIKGFDRSDVSDLASDIREQIFDILLRELNENNKHEIKEKIIKILRDAIKKFRKMEYKLSYICQSKGIRQPLEMYANQDWIRGARWFNDNAFELNTSIRYGVGSKPKFMYVIPSKLPSKYTKTDIVALDDYNVLPQDIIDAMDIDTMLEKTLVIKVEDLLFMLDIKEQDYISTARIKTASIVY